MLAEAVGAAVEAIDAVILASVDAVAIAAKSAAVPVDDAVETTVVR